MRYLSKVENFLFVLEMKTHSAKGVPLERMPVIVIVNAFSQRKYPLCRMHMCVCEHKIATSYGGLVDFSMVFASTIFNEKKTWNRMPALVWVSVHMYFNKRSVNTKYATWKAEKEGKTSTTKVHSHTHTHAHIFWGVWYIIIWLPCTTTWQHAVHLILCLVSTLTKYFYSIKAIEGWIGWESKCALKKWAQHYHGTACNVALFEKKRQNYTEFIV